MWKKQLCMNIGESFGVLPEQYVTLACQRACKAAMLCRMGS